MKVQRESFQSRFARRFLERTRAALPERVLDQVDLDYYTYNREASLKSLLQASKLLSQGVVRGLAPLALAGEVALEVVDLAEEEEWAQALDRQAVERMPESEDPVARERLGKVAALLAPHTHRPVNFTAVQGSNTNGFAALSGRIYVTEDLAREAPLEALTWLAGHEVGHTESRDSIKTHGYQTLVALLEEAGGSWMKFTRSIPFTPSHRLTAEINNEFTEIQRQEERAADARGIELTRAAGHRPQDTEAALQQLFARSSMQGDNLVLPVPERLSDLSRLLHP